MGAGENRGDTGMNEDELENVNDIARNMGI